MPGIYGSPYGGFGGYYDPNQSYGSPWGSPNAFLSTPLGGIGANLDPDAYYQRWISPWGAGDDPFSRWAQSQQGRVLSALAQARLTNPNLGIQDFLPTLGGFDQFRARYRQMDPGDRGERWGVYAPVTRVRGW